LRAILLVRIKAKPAPGDNQGIISAKIYPMEIEGRTIEQGVSTIRRADAPRWRKVS
jgi:hypothetical protein